MHVLREIQDHIQKTLFKGKVIVIYGARRVGKTTLVKQIQKNYQIVNISIVNCYRIKPHWKPPTAKS